MAEESAKQQAAACKNRVRLQLQLHKSFLHLSKALKKLHARRGGGGGHQANASGGGGEGEPQPPTPSPSAAASFLSGCMHNPRTHSFASGRRHRRAHDDDDDDDLGDATLAVNFRSLRIGSSGAAVAGDGGSSSPQDRYSSSGGGGGDGASEERDVVAPPLPPTPAAAPADKSVFGGDGVAVVTFSAAPYEDFRRSIREMVDAAAVRSRAGAASASAASPAVDWDFMEELLFCYLHLNDRAVHSDILRAFTDTVAALRRRRRATAAAKKRRTRRRGAAADRSSDGGAVAPSSHVPRGRGGA